METAAGKSLLGQIAFGFLRFYTRSPQELPTYSQLDWREETERFHLAQHQSVLELAALYDRAYRQVGEGMAAIFAIHAMLLEDEDLVKTVLTMIREKGTTAEYATQVTGKSFAAAFAAMDSTYMQARAVDLLDISRRVVRCLLGRERDDPLEKGPAILVADQFFPSEVMDLDQHRLLGLISRRGSVDSHTAMLLRAYGIPAMAEVELSQAWDGHLALLDGFGHQLYLDPDQETVEKLRKRYQEGGKPKELLLKQM